MTITLEEYVAAQKEWSVKTFGPGMRTKGITRHIRTELEEIEDDPNDITEWLDVAILALDGYWRAGGDPNLVMFFLARKQAINLQRVFPVPASEDTPSFHIKEGTT